MAFFKLRKAAGEQPAPAPAPESVDALRRRARYRLAGAAILVLAGVIGFPMLFDNQPRPIAVDIPIDIPDKAKVRPMPAIPATEVKPVDVGKPTLAGEPNAAPAPPSAARAADGLVGAAVATAPIPQSSKLPAKESQKEEVLIASPKPAASLAPPKADDKLAAKTDGKPEPRTDSADSAKTPDSTTDKAATTRFIVQFGAFSDSAHAHEARLKVEKAGLKTYAQIAETPDGKRFRVRVGPFDKRSDAEKAAEKIKKVGLPAAILGL
jgi:DedD protein